MVEDTNSRQIVSGSGWGIWIAVFIGLFIIIAIIYGAWRLWRSASNVVSEEVTPVVQTQQTRPTFRLIRTPTEIIVVDDPIIPEGETAVEDIVRTPLEFLGEEVIISGTVTDFESAEFFALHQDEDNITIMALPEAIESSDLEGSLAPEDQPIRVRGIVKRLTREIEKTGFGLEIRNIDEAFWSDQIVIEAITITKVSALTT